MNEAGGEPKFELPSQPGQIPEQPAEGVQETDVEKQHPSKHEAGVGKSAPQPGSTATTDADMPQTTNVPVIPKDDDKHLPVPVSPSTDDLKAGDGDLIEKEWVHRAKTIVSQTQDDPHRQKSEMSKAKADYIHKRFKKIIKTDETAAA